MALELELDPSKLDSDVIARLHRRHHADPTFENAAEVTREVLVYHRGIGQAQCEGLFILEKVTASGELPALAFARDNPVYQCTLKFCRTRARARDRRSTS